MKLIQNENAECHQAWKVAKEPAKSRRGHFAQEKFLVCQNYARIGEQSTDDD